MCGCCAINGQSTRPFVKYCKSIATNLVKESTHCDVCIKICLTCCTDSKTIQFLVKRKIFDGLLGKSGRKDKAVRCGHIKTYCIGLAYMIEMGFSPLLPCCLTLPALSPSCCSLSSIHDRYKKATVFVFYLQ